ncbi:hypothetical protein A7982_13336 [Minicystis rosea]|nr:hypothetical protein A7982_13336 [Minicystis rosea]
MSAFDPAALRASYAQYSALEHARQLANEPLNLFFWDSALAEVACSYMIGIGAESTPQELLSLTRRVLSEADSSGAIDEEADADEEGLFRAASAMSTLALAEWIATGEHQRALFDRAYAFSSRYFARSRKQKPSLKYGVFSVVTAAVAAERFDDAKRFLESTVPDKKLDPAKSRTVAELALALATVPAPHTDAAERFLRSNLAERLEHGGYIDAAMQLYLASVAKLPGSARELLERATQYVSYLAAAEAKREGAKAKPQTRKAPKSKRPVPPPAPSHPRPARIIPSSAGFEDAVARVAAGRGNSDHIWQETPDGWAVQMRGFASRDRELISRRDRLVEIFESRTVPEAHTYPSLQRASLDGATLSECARASGPLPLEVAFAPAVDNWVDGRMVPTPPKLSRKIWKDALAVGALVNLRAISIDARESAKEQLARGDEPYAITPSWFWTTALAAQLEALEVIADPHDLGTSLSLFDSNPRLRELVVWFETRWIFTACFWFERADDGMHLLVQSARSPVTEEWRSLLATVLPRATATRLRRVEVTVKNPSGADESAIREMFAPHANVDAVHIGAALREL